MNGNVVRPSNLDQAHSHMRGHLKYRVKYIHTVFLDKILHVLYGITGDLNPEFKISRRLIFAHSLTSAITLL